MATLQYRGAALANPTDLVYQDYMATLKSGDMSTAAIDSAINSGLAGFATTAYVDQQDGFNATKAYVDGTGGANPNGGDAARIHLTQQNIANGWAPLDANSRVSPVRINLPPTQRWFKGPWTPSAYLSSPISVSSGETTLYPAITVADPGYPYKLMVFGMIDGRSSVDAEYPIVNIRGDTITGEIVAVGAGMADAADTGVPSQGDHFTGTASGLPAGDWSTLVTLGTGGQYNESGSGAVWADSGGSPRTIKYQRVNPADAQTQTDYQKIQFSIGTSGDATFGGGDQYVVLTGRESSDGSSWAGLYIGPGAAQFIYSVGGSTPAGIAGAGSFALGTGDGSVISLLLGTAANIRQLQCYRNNVLISSVTDTGSVTQLGAGFRGWGFIGHADQWGGGISQTTPPSITSLLIGDAVPSYGRLSIVPRSPGTMATRTGATTLYVRGTRSGTTSVATFSPFQPRLNIWVIPA